MARFLLSTGTFLGFAATKNSSVRAWLEKARDERNVKDVDLAVSVMSLVRLERLWLNPPSSGLNPALQHRCAVLAQEFRDRRTVLQFGDEALSTWLNVHRAHPEFDQEESFVVATAIEQRLTLLDKDLPEHERFKQLGLHLEVIH